MSESKEFTESTVQDALALSLQKKRHRFIVPNVYLERPVPWWAREDLGI